MTKVNSLNKYKVKNYTDWVKENDFTIHGQGKGDYLAEITGPCDKYGLKRRFLRNHGPSKNYGISLFRIDLKQPAIYEERCNGRKSYYVVENEELFSLEISATKVKELFTRL